LTGGSRRGRRWASGGEPEPLVDAALASRGVARRGGQAAGVIKDAGDSSAVMSCCCSAARHGSVFRFVLPPPAGANLFLETFKKKNEPGANLQEQ